MTIHSLRVQRPSADSRADVLYVHGSTFGAGLSIFYRLDGRSWADALNDAGFTAWGFDFAGYGDSERYPPDSDRAVGRLEQAVPQLLWAIQAVRERNGGRPIHLLGHSWGATVAAACAAAHPDGIAALVLFAPIVMRAGPTRPAGAYIPAAAAAATSTPSHYPLTLWAQYRRFVEDVPRGQSQVFSEAHFQAWGEAFLATDPQAQSRTPPAVSTPAGPQRDVQALWSGQSLYDPSRIAAPTLLVRGEWDTVCDADDAASLLAAVNASASACGGAVIERATHLMHLEAQRGLLYDAVNTFLLRSAS
ncbi:alpha/beta hydrolase [Duganella aceris]|uniref:Alpha/beta hydrolase n=1 Tax=Duganella aceris TaxID=2703883 RepID=A0ABX0FEG4_9BURK|nr:alpha/beta hydrolase [Duganella aceris]NGZ82671.1 alpha/beta hydrolase [Duganella aceris]